MLFLRLKFPLIGKLLEWSWLIALLSACQGECPDNEIVGEARLTATTKQVVAFTEEKTLTYINATGDQLRLTRYDGDESDNDLVFTTIVQTCQEGWLDQSSIGLYTERVVALYESEVASIYLDAGIRSIVQPNPYDTVLVDLLDVSISNRRTGNRSSSIGVPTSLRNNTLDPSVLDSALVLLTSYRLIADTVLSGTPLTNAYYTLDTINGGEVFITAEQGVAAFRIDSTLWLRE